MDKSDMRLCWMVSWYVLGGCPVDKLPEIARTALEFGYDSPALRVLAVSDGDAHDVLKRSFVRALKELGIEVPTLAKAGINAAHQIASEIVQGKVDPYTGARRIWYEVYSKVPELVELRPFVGFASEYEDDPSHRLEYTQLIIQEAVRLLDPVAVAGSLDGCASDVGHTGDS
jgi:hypothetical protein